jgi:gephyrin
VPSGATAVVMVEDTTLISASADGLQEETVEIHVQARDNGWIREIGSDTNVGAIVARKGELVTAVGGEIGVMASVGVREVSILNIYQWQKNIMKNQFVFDIIGSCL